MTVTVTVTEPGTKVPEQPVPVLTVKAQALWRAVYNAMLFASTDEMLQAINAVRFARDATGCLEVLATDRYRVYIEKVEHEAPDLAGAFEFSMALPDAKQLTTFLKSAGKLADAMLAVEDGRLRISVNGMEIALPFLDASWPQYRNVVPSEDTEKQAVDVLCLNPKYLSDLAKLKFDHGGPNAHPATFHFYGMNKPVVIRFDDSMLLMQMPVRIQ